MKSTVLWALVALNVVLLVSFLGRVFHESSAVAQVAKNRPGDYLLIPAEINGTTNGIVVVLDQTDTSLSAISYDDANNRFESMPKIDLAHVFNAGTVSPPPGLKR